MSKVTLRIRVQLEPELEAATSGMSSEELLEYSKLLRRWLRQVEVKLAISSRELGAQSAPLAAFAAQLELRRGRRRQLWEKRQAKSPWLRSSGRRVENPS